MFWLDGAIASQPTLSVPAFSKTGSKWVPLSSVFQTPLDAIRA